MPSVSEGFRNSCLASKIFYPPVSVGTLSGAASVPSPIFGIELYGYEARKLSEARSCETSTPKIPVDGEKSAGPSIVLDEADTGLLHATN